MAYNPKPIDTSDVKISSELEDLVETLAKNNHDNWSKKRLGEGWTLGPRNDGEKTHPCLVDYRDLTEVEKEYDRVTAMEAVKVLLKLNYKIAGPDQRLTSDSDFNNDIISKSIAQLKSKTKFDLQKLITIWDHVPKKGILAGPEIFELLGNRMLKLGEPLIAYDVLSEGLNPYKTNKRLRQLQGLSLARIGAVERANSILTGLYNEGNSDGETLGILARTHKDYWEIETNQKNKSKHLNKAYSLYYGAYKLAAGKGALDDAIFTGINSASMALLGGKKKKAADLAREVVHFCTKKLKKESNDYWALASLGEASIILSGTDEKEWQNAENYYTRAGKAGKGNFADLSSTRRNLRLLLEVMGKERNILDHCFNIPGIVVFAGHMIDQPGRKHPRLPAELEQVVSNEILKRLKEMNSGFGYASAACGSDILFHEAILKLKGESNIVLPFATDEFAKASVDIIPGSNWVGRFRRLLRKSARVTVASSHNYSGTAISYEYSNLLQDGLALLRAQILDADITPLVVWDGNKGDGIGGTHSIVEHWRRHGREPEIINTNELLENTAIEIKKTARKPKTAPVLRQKNTPSGFPQMIKAMLFADVVKYSTLSEEDIPRFVKYFMGSVSRLLTETENPPVAKNTWGDALYFVFDSTGDAGMFALCLQDMVYNTKWADKNLPDDLNLRIALHAGPVFSYKDPVTDLPGFTGSHVSRAARIEPVTPPGHVYASQPFAALSSAQGVTSFICEYVGQTPHAKDYGTYPTYHVRKSTCKTKYNFI